MSLNSVVSNQLKNSGKRLSSLKNLSRYLLEDVQNRMEKHTIEPVHPAESALLSASVTVTTASSTQITDSNIFLNSTSKMIREEIRKTIGHSPDIFSDIAKAITKPVKDIIQTALKPIKRIIDVIPTTVKDFVKEAATAILGGFNVVGKSITGFVQDGFNLVGEGVNFIKSSIKGLLSGVTNIFSTFILIFKKAFDDLALKLEAILRITPEAMFNLQKELQDLFEKEQAKLVKSLIKEE